MFSRLLLFATAIVPPALPAFEISGFHISPQRQVEIELTADAKSPEYRLEYLDGESWFEDVRATVERSETGVRVFTRLPGKADSRFYRVVGLEPKTTSALRLSEIVSDSSTGSDWIELINASDQPIAIGGYGLGDDPDALFKTTLPAQTLEPGARFVVSLNDFGIDHSGETLYLTAPDRALAERLKVPPLREDESLARRGDEWFIMDDAEVTRGEANIVGGERHLESPRFSIRGGRYEDGLTVRLAAGHEIRYTLDGSEPDAGSPIYEQPFFINAVTAIRARCFAPDGTESRINTQNYFIGLTHTLPIIAMTAPPENFEFHQGYLYGMGSVLTSTGVFRTGNTYPYSSSNAWKNREVETNFELFEPDGERGFNIVAGLKIFGGWGSRGYPQKSMAVFARRKYGFGKIRHQLFPDRDIQDFETFVLRNSGNDNQSTHLTYPRSEIRDFGPPKSYGSYFVNCNFTLFRDAMLGSLGNELGLDTQGYRPAVLYLNGDYWGIYNIREKLNEHYVESHYGVPSNEVDVIEGYGSANAGTGTAYSRMRSLVNSTNTEEEYREVEETHIDIANFIDYHLCVIFFQNFDIGNIKSWRSRVEGADGRFRWLLYDQDYGFNLWPEEVYQPAMKRDFSDYANIFAFYTKSSGSGWPNGADRTLLLRKLLGMEEFKTRFILRCADLLNSTFHQEHVTARIDAMAAVIRPEIPAHLERWSWASLVGRGFGEPHKEEDAPLDLAHWERNVQTMIRFANERPAQLQQDLIDHFKLGNGVSRLVIDASAGGEVQINTLPPLNEFAGSYFIDYPPPLTALPLAGYKFVEWVGPVTDPQAIETFPILEAGNPTVITAKFVPN